MQVREAMSDDVQIASPNQSIRDAAILMAKSTPARCRSATTIVWWA